jgi:2-dehydropantoate 2-reductase
MDIRKYKIGIVGLGPVGMILAVHLKQAGCNVIICDSNKEKVNNIQSNGIILFGAIEKSSFFDQVCMTFQELIENEIDLLISCVKTYRVESLLDVLKNKKHDLYLLSAQNGIDIGLKYARVVDESKILRMVINFGGNLTEQNVVKVTYQTPPHYIASIADSCTDVAEWIAKILTFTGQQTEVINSFELMDKVWKKTILISSISPLCGITKLTIKEALKSAETVDVIEQTIIEAMEVAKAEGIKFEDNFVKMCIRELKSAGDHFPSLGVDILKGEETEIDYNNGKIVEYGRKHYIATPLNLTFTNLVNAISKKNIYGFPGCSISGNNKK